MSVNVENIRALQAALLAEPALYYQGSFGKLKDPIKEVVICNTECCIASHAFILAGFKDQFLKYISEPKGVFYHSNEICNTAKKYLGLKSRMATVLFDISEQWPVYFGDKMTDTFKIYRRDNFRFRLKRAQIACEFLDLIIETDGDLDAINKHCHELVWNRR